MELDNMTKDEFINLVSKVNETGEDEFKAEYKGCFHNIFFVYMFCFVVKCCYYCNIIAQFKTP